ncbi:hypothetical protein TWF281_008655 [Arthrobotrys megalospora]
MRHVAIELKDHQKSLQGAWISSRDWESIGSIDDTLFEALDNGLPYLKHLHLGGFNRPVEAAKHLSLLQNLLPRLKSFTFHLCSSGLLLPFINTERSWEKFSQRYSVNPNPPAKLSQVTSLSLKLVGDIFFESTKQLDEIFDVEKLQILKLFDTGKITNTLERLQKSQLNLKVFYLSGEATGKVLQGFLVSLSGLHELYLDISNCESKHCYTLGLDFHRATLSRLFVRYRIDGRDLCFGESFCKFLKRGEGFPVLTELALSSRPEYVGDLRHHGEKLPKLQLLWLLSNPHNWTADRLKFSKLNSHFHPLFRSEGNFGPRWPFVAIGDRSRSEWPLIFELCESEAVSGENRTSLAYLTHRELFNHSPHLELLNATELWLPGDRGRGFIESQDRSTFNAVNGFY